MSNLTQYRHIGRPGIGIKRKITDDEKTALVNAFYECDAKHKGFLTREDFKVAVVSLFGYKPSKYEVDEFYGSSGEEGSSGMVLERFLDLMSAKVAVQDEEEEIRQSFLAFDAQCRGFLTLEDLRKAVSLSAPHLPGHVVESAFREVDRDGDGRVSYKDFEFMMKYNRDNGF